MITLFRKKKPELSFLEETKKSLWGQIKSFILPEKKKFSPELLADVEELLISLDLGVDTSDVFLKKVKEKVTKLEELTDQDLSKILQEVALEIIPEPIKKSDSQTKPKVVLLVGVNGAGKTTTISKLAHKYKTEAKKVLVVAADTFRAAAVDQLKSWIERVGVSFFSNAKASPSTVVYEGIKRGIEENFDIVLIDTAGRLHTKKNLMEELNKVYRTAEKVLQRKPNEVFLVIDGTSGQNAMTQSEEFIRSSNATGFIVTKLDGTSKGGIVISLSTRYKIPVKYLGIGETIDDLLEFEKEQFIKHIFAIKER